MAGIRRTYTNKNANGNANKIIIETSDGKAYRVRANQLNGKTEQDINAALNLWLSANMPDQIGKVGVHVNRDGTYVLWTGALPDEWPEDEIQPE